tara:strand:+ start:1949 stop:2212 length:264 start_codon:yes stop_codon:yes gene_type:complete
MAYKQKRTVERSDVDGAGNPARVKTVTIIRGNKKIVKKKIRSQNGVFRKLKTKYKGYNQLFSRDPDVKVSQTYTMRNNGNRSKENLM